MTTSGSRYRTPTLRSVKAFTRTRRACGAGPPVWDGFPSTFLRAFAGRLTIEVHCLPPLERYPLQPQIVAIPEQFVHTAASPTQSALSRARRAAASAETHAKGRTRRENSRLQAKVAAV